MGGKRDRKKREKKRGHGHDRSTATMDPRAARKILDATTERVQLVAGTILRREDLDDTATDIADETRSLALKVIEQSPLRSQHACKAGCAFCCYTAVTVSPPEVFAIVDHLRRHCSTERLLEIQRKLDENAEKAASMSRSEYIAALVPCALLTDDNQCSAHAVRPLACAGFLSTSRSKCEAEFNRIPNRAPIPTDDFAMAAGVAASKGLLAACQAAEVDGQFYELHHVLRLVLDTPNAAARWARKEDIFKGCPT